MRPFLGLCLATAGLATIAGCTTLTVSPGASVRWSVPDGIEEPSTYGFASFCYPFPILGLTASFYGDTSEDATSDIPELNDLFTFDISIDLGYPLALPRIMQTGNNLWLVLRPLVGYWNWPDSPEGDGLLTGVVVGLAWYDRSDIHGLSVNYGWLWLNDAEGEDDARLETLCFSFSFPF